MFQPKFEPNVSKHMSEPLPLDLSFIYLLFKYCLQHAVLLLTTSPQQFILRPNFFSFLAVRDQVSHPYTARSSSITKLLYNTRKINALISSCLKYRRRIVAKGIWFFCILLTVHPCTIFFKWSQLGAHCFLVYLFQLLYMFRATMCPSSRELTVFYATLVLFNLYGWLSGLQTRLSPISAPDDGHIIARNM